MSIQMIMLKALLLIALLTNSCEDPMQEVDPDILNRNCPSGREDFIPDQDILYFDDYIGANGETLHDYLTRIVV